MPDSSSPDPASAEPAYRELAETFTALPVRHDQMASRLEFVADLIADAGPLPAEPALLWRVDGGAVQTALVGERIVVGRQPGPSGLAMSTDKSLSKTHFAIINSGSRCVLEDLGSRNGTAVNDPEQTISKKTLCDADLIFAGNQVFTFLDPRRTV